jgi:hypothetical protein
VKLSDFRSSVDSMAHALEVRLVQDDRFADNDIVHPTFMLAYDPDQRLVRLLEPAEHFLSFLPHEIAHCVWPDLFLDPFEEHQGGLIGYEHLTFLSFVPDDEIERALSDLFSSRASVGGMDRVPIDSMSCLYEFFDYAIEGSADGSMSADEVERRAREAKIPVLWGPREVRFHEMFLRYCAGKDKEMRDGIA